MLKKKFIPLSWGRKTVLALVALGVLFGGLALMGGDNLSISAQTEARPQATLKIERHIIGTSDRRPSSGSYYEYRIQGIIANVSGSEIVANDSPANPKDSLDPSFVGIGNLVWDNPDDLDNQVYSVAPVTTADGGVYIVDARIQNSWLEDTTLPDSTEVKVRYTLRNSSTGGLSDQEVAVRQADGTVLTLGDVKKQLAAGEAVEAKSTGAAEDVTTTAPTASAEVAGTEENTCDSSLLGSNPVKWAICNLVVSAADFMGKTTASIGESLVNFLNDLTAAAGDLLSNWVSDGWAVSRSIVNIVAVIALIIVAFANILHINLNTYAVKRILPILIGSIIAANLSLFAIKAAGTLSFSLTAGIADAAASGIGGLAKSVADLFGSVLLAALGLGGGPTGSTWGEVGTAALAGAITLSASPFVFVVFSLVFIVVIILLIILGFLILIQPGVVGILTILAPIAIIAGALPFGQGLFKKWLTYTINWLFMLPACLVIFTLMNTMAIKTSGAGTVEALFSVAGQAVLLLFAIRLPFTMGGDIAKAWGGVGKFLGNQGLSRTYSGALQSIAYSGEERKALDALKPEQRAAYLKNLGWYNRARMKYGREGGWAERLTKIHPSGLAAGFKQREEGRQAAIKGLEPSFSKGYQTTGNRAAQFMSDAESEEKKVADYTDRELAEKYLDHEGKGYITPRSEKFSMANTLGGFGSKFANGALPEIPADKAANVRAVIREAAKREFQTGYGGEIVSLGLTAEGIKRGHLTRARDNQLAAALRAGLVDENRLKEELVNRYGVDEAGRALDRIVTMASRGGGYNPSGSELGSGAEDSGVQRVDPTALASGYRPKDIDDEMWSAMRAKEQEIADIANSTAKTVESTGVVTPVAIQSAPELEVVDKTVTTQLKDNASQIDSSMKKAGASEADKSSVFGAMESARIAPEDINRLVEEKGTQALTGDVKLTRPTDLLLRKFVLTASRGKQVTQATAERYYRENLQDITPYVDRITQEVNAGRLDPKRLGVIGTQLDEQLKALRSGTGVSQEQIKQLTDNLRLVSPGVGIAPNMTNEDLTRTGTVVSSAIKQMQSPSVVEVLQQRGNPQRVKEIIVRQAANNLVRETTIERMNNEIRRTNEPAQTRIQEVSRQVSNYAGASPSAQQWQGLNVETRRRIAEDVASRIISQKQVSSITVNNEIGRQITVAASRGGVSARESAKPVVVEQRGPLNANERLIAANEATARSRVTPPTTQPPLQAPGTPPQPGAPTPPTNQVETPNTGGQPPTTTPPAQ